VISIYYLPHADNRFFSSAYMGIRASQQFFFSRLVVAPHGDSFLSRRAATPHGNSFYPALWQGLTAIHFILPRGGASWRFFLTCLTAVPHGDSFSSASLRRLLATPFIPLLFKRALIIF
jgi:hypothetical protein